MGDMLQVFQYQSDQVVRVVQNDKGELLFVAKDVCAVLGIINHKDAIKRLDDDQKDGVVLTDPIGRDQKLNALTESGLYELILRSDKPYAKAFRKWITSDVLPTLRKTGKYEMSPEMWQDYQGVKLLAMNQGVRVRELQSALETARDLNATQEDIIRHQEIRLKNWNRTDDKQRKFDQRKWDQQKLLNKHIKQWKKDKIIQLHKDGVCWEDICYQSYCTRREVEAVIAVYEWNLVKEERRNKAGR